MGKDPNWPTNFHLERMVLDYDGTPHNPLLVLPRHRMGVPSELDEARSGVPLDPGYFYHSNRKLFNKD